MTTYIYIYHISISYTISSECWIISRMPVLPYPSPQLTCCAETIFQSNTCLSNTNHIKSKSHCGQAVLKVSVHVWIFWQPASGSSQETLFFNIPPCASRGKSTSIAILTQRCKRTQNFVTFVAVWFVGIIRLQFHHFPNCDTVLTPSDILTYPASRRVPSGNWCRPSQVGTYPKTWQKS